MTILEQIVEYKNVQLPSLKRHFPLKDLQKKAADTQPALPFASAFEKPSPYSIIAEIKKASPSLGVIKQNYKPVDVALSYQDHGARALSILTEDHFFQGALSHLEEVKKRVGLPCLRKDFTLSEYHVFEARAAGADAILLIAAILDDAQMKGFQELATELGMEVLLEVHDEKELDRALQTKASLIGVNNRNLNTFQVNLKTSLDLIKKIPSSLLKVSESGIKTKQDLDHLTKAGFNGFLIGEAFMKENNPGEKLAELIGYPDEK